MALPSSFLSPTHPRPASTGPQPGSRKAPVESGRSRSWADRGRVLATPQAEVRNDFRRQVPVRPPMITDPLFYLAAVPAVILMGLSKGGLSGLSLLSLPLMALVVSPVQSAA